MMKLVKLLRNRHVNNQLKGGGIMAKEERPKYKLLYGFSRFEAVKKLGYSKIAAYNKKTGEALELELDDIDDSNNLRIRRDKSNEEIADLMRSIRNNGLLQPVGVVESDDVTPEEFFILNLTENLQRRDIGVFDLGNAIAHMRDNFDMSPEQIAVRLGVSINKINSAVRISSVFSRHEMEGIITHKQRQDGVAEGISIGSAEKIASSRAMGIDEKRKFLKIAKKNKFTDMKVTKIINLLRAGMRLNEALKNAEEYTTKYVQVSVNDDEFRNRLEGGDFVFQFHIRKLLQKADPKLFQ